MRIKRFVKENTITRINEAIVNLINGQKLKEGKLPSETELSEMLNVSRNSVRESLKSLETRGLVTRRHGVGTFATQRIGNINTQLNILSSTSEIISNHGYTPGNKLFAVELKPASAEIAGLFGMDRSTEFIYVERVRLANDNPIVYVKDYIKNDDCLFQILQDKDWQSIYAGLKSCGYEIAYAQCNISAVLSTTAIQEKLDLEQEQALLHLRQLHYLANNSLMMYSESFFITEKFEFNLLRNQL